MICKFTMQTNAGLLNRGSSFFDSFVSPNFLLNSVRLQRWRCMLGVYSRKLQIYCYRTCSAVWGIILHTLVLPINFAIKRPQRAKTGLDGAFPGLVWLTTLQASPKHGQPCILQRPFHRLWPLYPLWCCGSAVG